MNSTSNPHEAELSILRHHAGQSLLNLDILNYVAKNEPCFFDELLDLFGDVKTDQEAALKFRNRLSYLVCSQQLRCTGKGDDKRWYVPQVDRGIAPLEIEVEPYAYVGTVAAPRQCDVMHGPVYKPSPTPSLRPGALDFKTLPTRGNPC